MPQSPNSYLPIDLLALDDSAAPEILYYRYKDEIRVVLGGTGGITDLNGETGAIQSFATGTAGTDFGISSAANVHTFNLPVADATNTGKLSNTDWSTFNSKQNALTFGDLTEATSSILTILGGTGAVIGAGASIQVAQASGSTSGYLSSTDWNTFNGKQSALTFSTGLTNTAGTITANLSTGVAGGQSVIGGTAASEILTLSSTTNATKGLIAFGTSAYDEVNNRLGIGTQSPTYDLHMMKGFAKKFGYTFPIGLNDLTAAGTYTGTSGNSYRVIIDGTGTPDTFRWEKNFVTQASGVAITGGVQNLTDGVTIQFAATTGHTLDGAWTIQYQQTATLNTGELYTSGIKFGEVDAAGNTLIGAAGTSITGGIFNTCAGFLAGANFTTSLGLVLFGYKAGNAITQASAMTCVGFQSGMLQTTGGSGTYGGYRCFEKNVSGILNTGWGANAGLNNTGSTNTFVGAGSGQNSGGASGCVFIGQAAGFFETTNNKLYIHNTNSTTPLIYGDMDLVGNTAKVIITGGFGATVNKGSGAIALFNNQLTYISTGAGTVTLPTADFIGQVFFYKNDHTATITIQRAGTDLINPLGNANTVTSLSITTGNAAGLISDGAGQWFRIF